MTYRIIVTPNADEDLRRAHRFIWEHSPLAASRWSKGARAAIKSLRRNPERCSIAAESEVFREPIHELLYGKGNRGAYRILFTVEGRTVFVLHVRHGSMETLGV